MINVGIIGFGKMGQIRAETIGETNRGQVSAVYDPASNDMHYNKASNYQDVIDDKSIDAIFICTPNYLNQEITIKALKAGKHVFCEKPPTFTAAEMDEVIVNEEKSKKKLMYGFNHRHHESIKNMKSMIDSREYGNILWMRGRYGKSVDKSFYQSWRSKKEFAGGGILMDQGIHMLDLFLHFGGGFDQVQAMLSNLYWHLDVEDNAFVQLKNSKTNLVASLHSTMTQWRHIFSLEVFLEKGYLVLNGLKTSSNSYGQEVLVIAKNRSTAPAATWEDEQNITYDSDQSWHSEVNHFFNAIEHNSPIDYGSSQDALQLMKLLGKIYESQ